MISLDEIRDFKPECLSDSNVCKNKDNRNNNRDFVLVLSPQALLYKNSRQRQRRQNQNDILSYHQNNPDNRHFYYFFKVWETGDILAVHRRAAIDALVKLAKLPDNLESPFPFFVRQMEAAVAPRSGNLPSSQQQQQQQLRNDNIDYGHHHHNNSNEWTIQDLEAIYTSTPTRDVVWQRLDFGRNDPSLLLQLSGLTRPLTLKLDRPLFRPHAAALVQGILQRGYAHNSASSSSSSSSFGTLDLDSLMGLLSVEQARDCLANCPTAVLDELRWELSHHGPENLQVLQELLKCRRSIRRLVVWIRAAVPGLVDALVHAIVQRQTCPRRLVLWPVVPIPGWSAVVQAVRQDSASCLTECSLPMCMMTTTMATSLGGGDEEENGSPQARCTWLRNPFPTCSLQRIVLASTVDLANPHVWETLARLQHLRVIVVRSVHKVDRRLAQLVDSRLRQNRHWTLQFQYGSRSSIQEWRALVQPALSWNQFHCGVAESDAATYKKKGLSRDTDDDDRLWQQTLLSCHGMRKTNHQRTALLLHYQTARLVEWLSPKTMTKTSFKPLWV